ncbi:MAG TPA: hypothetical protein VMT53_22930 [Terriglobales bacterium]|nr:hypothetical protein [Terriglobales bacterium]
MEPSQTEVHEPTTSSVHDAPPPIAAPFTETAPQTVSPQACPSCGTAPAANIPNVPAAPLPPSFVYAIGNIEARFPNMGAEKEFAQALARIDAKGLNEHRARHSVLTKPENLYLLRQQCFVMTIRGLETYIVMPRNPSDYHLLAETIRANPSPADLDVVIGMRGPIAPPQMCNGLMVPVVAFDQTYSFDRPTLLKSMPRANGTSEKDFEATAGELLDRVLQMTDSAGSFDEHRALNYLAVRYPAIYHKTAEAHGENKSLTSVHVQRSRLSGVRNVHDVIFTYTHRTTDVAEKHFVRVDVTDEFPFLVTKLSPYYDV